MARKKETQETKIFTHSGKVPDYLIDTTAEIVGKTIATYFEIPQNAVNATQNVNSGMGNIYFCQDKRTGEYCVLKTFKEEKSNLETFNKEAEFALSLERHPNIVYTKTVVTEKSQNFVIKNNNFYY